MGKHTAKACCFIVPTQKGERKIKDTVAFTPREQLKLDFADGADGPPLPKQPRRPTSSGAPGPPLLSLGEKVKRWFGKGTWFPAAPAYHINAN
jgi:hypothetical protein